MLHIYNSLTNKKEPLIPINEQKIGIYVCGMTVYDYCHLGHARVMVAFDAVIRYLRYRGYEVAYVRNITDIDDKIIARARELGESIGQLTDRFIGCMHEDLAFLGIAKPNHEPRATEYIPQIIDMISALIERGFAYPASNGDVYYKTRSFDAYGQLSGKNLDELQAGARVGVDECKEDPLDFVLWKSSKKGEPWWDSPWGRGRPGWHIECSAMSTCLLGNHFDIHAGGMDLLFPHHENEIAQSVGATGGKFANLWMHNGYLQVDATKMSKSLKNFLTIREILDLDSSRERMGLILRYMLLSGHYRSPLNYSEDNLDHARSAVRRIFVALSNSERFGANRARSDASIVQQFCEIMDDDFNTPEALALIFETVRALNRAVESDQAEQAAVLRETVAELAGILGLMPISAKEFLDGRDDNQKRREIEQMIELRKQARLNKDWAEADRLRGELLAMGVEIEDQADGATLWRLG